MPHKTLKFFFKFDINRFLSINCLTIKCSTDWNGRTQKVCFTGSIDLMPPSKILSYFFENTLSHYQIS